MEDEAEKERLQRSIIKNDTATYATIFKTAVALIMIVMLLWTTYIGFLFATIPGRNPAYNSWLLFIGVVTMLFGSLLLILGLPILADLLLSLSSQFQVQELCDCNGDIVDLESPVKSS
ncbi:hypothetical protein CRG98_042402 [Punica granatum]|uniref:Uncharacterized protein n=1 Tax=Punica granatum TaxID=22663 RepID=A0A2I0HZR9_PUNGR|nr:hypothetical protein CRG98_042402 [Punica granatum]